MSATSRILLATTLTSMALIGLTACERQGPLEEAGERADETVEEVGEGIEDAGNDLRDATQP